MTKKHIGEMLKKYSALNSVRFHMPGHKGKTNALDVTELSATDNLNNPENSIYEAQQSLKKSYGCAYSFFMVNGSTGAIQAMIKYASLKSDKPILMSRNAHKSIALACMMFKIDCKIIDDKFDDNLQTFVFDENQVIKSIMQGDLSAAIITSADYFGRVIDVKKISKACKKKGVLLLCDEAHGAHFHISDMLPQSALQYADLCAQSPHKTLSALTQCAYLHAAETIDIDKLKNVIYSLQTSSPSFLFIKSLDDARYSADIMKDDWEKRIETIKKLNEKLNNIDGIKIMNSDWAKQSGYIDKDVTRLVIDVSRIGSGIEIGRKLESQYNIFMEMSTFKYIVGILTPWDDVEWDNRLYFALKEIAKQKAEECNLPNYPKPSQRAVSMAQAIECDWVKVKLDDSAGEVAAAAIGAYPPGIALVLPGEVITQEAIDYMLKIRELGGSIFGAEKGYVNCVNTKGEQ